MASQSGSFHMAGFSQEPLTDNKQRNHHYRDKRRRNRNRYTHRQEYGHKPGTGDPSAAVHAVKARHKRFTGIFSTMTDWILMAPAVIPIPVPNISSATASSSGEVINESKGSEKIILQTEARITFLQLYFAVRYPVSGMANNAPPPRQSRRVPNVASFTPVLAPHKAPPRPTKTS